MKHLLQSSLQKKICLNRDINTLIISRDEYTKQISRLDHILKDAKSKLDLFTKDRRGGEESLPLIEYFSRLEQTEPTILDVYLKV
jgi:hypothetical protein